MRGTLTLALLLGCTGTTPQPTDVDPVVWPPDCPADVCEGSCTDIDEDPFNCGDCGNTCVIDHALPVCVNGGCELGACEVGWGDCDGDPLNGCEEKALCIAGGACETTCGSLGSLDCANACAPVCDPPVETCNGVDDDCDGDCDEELEGCRAAVYRSDGPVGHLYGLDVAEAEALDQDIYSERYFDVMAVEAPGTVPLFRCANEGGKRFLTTSPTCESLDNAPEKTLGFIGSTDLCDGARLYGMYNEATDDHLYTISVRESERSVELGYELVGVVGYVWRAPR
ncbi:MAG: hypothetical protein AB8H79_00230 [Myxococcota bacterium]